MNTSDESPPPPDSPNPAPEPNFTEGQKLAGVFVLRREVRTVAGERIWLAHDEILGKDVSLHFIPEALRTDERTMAELRAEIKKNRQLINQGVLRVYDLIEESNWAAVSMDWFEGESLAALLEKKGGGGFSVAEIEPWVRQICQTLDQIHKIPIVHRNLNPANFYLNGAGKVLIAKFGVSRAIEEARQRMRSRADGPDAQLASVSPQQLDGESPNKLDDIYSLGATLFQLLTGQLPFTGNDLVAQIRRTPAPSAAQHGAQGVPAAWEKTIAACLAKDSVARPQTAGAVGQALESGAKGAFPTSAPAALAPAPAREKAKEKAPAAAPEELKILPVPVKAAEPVAESVKEAVREKRKLPPPPTETLALERPEETEATGQHPEAGPRSGAPVTAAAAIALLAGIVGLYVYSTHRPHTAAEPQPPVNKDLVAVVKPEPTPAPRPVATPAVVKPPVPTPAPMVVALPVEKPSPTPAPFVPATPAPIPIIVGEPRLEDPVTTVAVAGSPLEHAVATGPKLAANTSRKPTPAPAREPATPAPAPVPVPPANGGAPLPASAGSADVAGRQAALEKAREASTGAERAYQEALKKQQSAEAALVQIKKGVDDKTAAMAPVLKASEELQADQKKREEAAQAAESAAREARQTAEAQMRQAEQKARQAEDAKKALTDWKMLNGKKLSARTEADTELQTLRTSFTEKQQAAAALAKATTDAEASRQAQLASVNRAIQEVAAAQAAAEVEQRRQAEEARKAAAAQLAQEMAELQNQLKVLREKAEKLNAPPADAAHPVVNPAPATPAPANPATLPPKTGFTTPAPATPALVAKLATPAPVLPATPAPALVVATPRPATPAPVAVATPKVATPAPVAVATPAPAPTTPAPVALATPAPATPAPVVLATPAPATPAPIAMATPAPAVVSPAPDGYENSLGMKFAPVGDVMFAIWPTRVQDFEVFAQEANVRNKGWRSPGFKQGPTHPVVDVTWIDAMAFCKWLSDKEHRKNILPKDQIYRLPTDLEWSHAVGLGEEVGRTPKDRDMGVPDVFPWGSQWPPPKNAGNYTGEETQSEAAIVGYEDGFPWTSPVGSFPANKYGLYDVGGNVWQWCMDNWDTESKAKVLRGASWYNGALKLSLLSSCRLYYSPESSTDNFGFRVIRAADAPLRRTR